MSTITSGNHNGKLYKISFVNGYYQLSIYDRNLDSFVAINNQFSSVQEAEQFLRDSY